MINLSELVREEGNLGLLSSLKFACFSEVYLAEDVGDFLVNKDRIYIPPYRVLPIFNERYYYAIMYNVFLNRVNNTSTGEWWNVGDESGKFPALWHATGGYTFERAEREQGFKSGDEVYSIILKQYDKSEFPIIVGLDKSRDTEVVRNSLLDRVKDKLSELLLGDPVPN